MPFFFILSIKDIVEIPNIPINGFPPKSDVNWALNNDDI